MTPEQQARIESLLGETELGELLFMLYRKGLITPYVDHLHQISPQEADCIIARLEKTLKP